MTVTNKKPILEQCYDYVDYLEPEVDNRTGEIIYLDNRVKIIRTSDQVEKIRALINF